MFELDDLGSHDLKGFAKQVQVWSISGARRTEIRFDATRAESLTELIGRDEEIEILLRRWERAKNGEGQLVLITGEPGIGKSRLARELRERIAGDRPTANICPTNTRTPVYDTIAFNNYTADRQRDASVAGR